MKFLFLARFSPDVKIVSQIYQNKERIRVKTVLTEVGNFLLRDPGEYSESDTVLGHGRAQFNSVLREAGVTVIYL